MENIVNSLFADYLPRRQQEPVGVADPRQQTMLTNQMLTPVMNKPVKPSQKVPVFPSVGGIGGGTVPTQPPAAPVSDQTLTPVMPKPTPPTEEAPEFASVGGIGGGVVPTAEETPAPFVFDPSTIDTGGFDLTNLGLFQEGGIADDVFKGLDITQRDEINPDAWVDIFNDYSSFLGGVQSGDTTKKVNRRDDIYNNYFKQAGGTYQGDPAALRASVGLSDAFSVYDNPEGQVTSESVQGAYQALTSGASPVEALSAYYGFDFQPAVNEGSNYSNAHKYGVTSETMSEFQSLIEPILQKSIPYIQATQGLEYTDALEYAYTHDPMINALYQSYGVDLYRQTKDGSTYIYDPIAGQEIRTLEVKDAKFKDFLPAIALTVATAGIGSAIGGAIANSSLGAALGTAGSNALGSAVAGIGTAAASGARGSDLVTAGVLSGLGGYAKGLGEVAKGAAAGSQAAIDAAAKADIFNNISKVANAADAIADKNYFKLLNMGLEAGGFDSFNTLTANKLNDLGGADGTLLGLNVDQLAPAVNEFAKDILKGKDVDKALLGAVGEYIKQGGALDNFKLGDFKFPDFDFNTPDGIKGIEDFVKDNWSSLKKSPFVQGLREVGRDVDDNVIQPLIDPLKGLDKKIDDLIQTPDNIKSIEDILKKVPQQVDDLIDTPDPIKNIEDTIKNLPETIDDLVDTPDWVKGIEDWFKGLEFPDININMPNLQIPQQQMGTANLMGDFAMSDIDAGIESVTPSELFAQKDYLAGLLD